MAAAADRKPVPETLIDKIAAVPDGRVAEVEDFVDFLRQREAEAATAQALRTAAMMASEASFAAVWNSPKDDVYDDLYHPNLVLCPRNCDPKPAKRGPKPKEE